VVAPLELADPVPYSIHPCLDRAGPAQRPATW
jgi:hypothetical protein